MLRFWRTSDNGFFSSPHEHNLHITCIPHSLYLPMITRVYLMEHLHRGSVKFQGPQFIEYLTNVHVYLVKYYSLLSSIFIMEKISYVMYVHVHLYITSHTYPAM